MSDNTELKRLAEAAPEGPWFGPEYAPGTSYVFDVDLGTLLHYESIDTEQDACLRYVAAANPAAVLALIAENDELRNVGSQLRAFFVDATEQCCKAERERDQLRAEVAGLKTGYEAYERVNAELKAENEALRIALESCADELEGQVIQCYHGQPVEDMHPVTRRSYDRDILCVAEARAAMDKGEQS